MKKKLLLLIAMSCIYQTSMAQLFTQKANFFEQRLGPVSFVLNNDVYSGTGFNSAFLMNSGMYKYQVSTDTWLQLNNFPTVMSNGSKMVINDTAYAGFGYDGVGVSGWYQYNAASDTWIPKNSTSNAGLQAGTFTLNGKGYAACGNRVFTGDHNELWQYDPAADIWTQKSTFPGGARNSPFADTIGGFAYVGLGEDINLSIAYADMYKYDPVADTWTSITPIPNSSTGVIAQGACSFHASYNGKIIIMALGSIAPTVPSDYNTIYVYDPPADSWTLYENANTIGARAAPITAQIGNKAYYGSGTDPISGTVHQDFWEVDLNSVMTSIENSNPDLKNISVKSLSHYICTHIPDGLLAKGIISLELFSVDGKKVKQFKLSGNDYLNVNANVMGAYIYLVKSNGRTLKSGKLMIE